MNNDELFALLNSINNSRDIVLKEIKARNVDWETLVKNGFFATATIAYRNESKCDLVTAHEFIKEYRKANNL